MKKTIAALAFLTIVPLLSHAEVKIYIPDTQKFQNTLKAAAKTYGATEETKLIVLGKMSLIQVTSADAEIFHSASVLAKDLSRARHKKDLSIFDSIQCAKSICNIRLDNQGVLSKEQVSDMEYSSDEQEAKKSQNMTADQLLLLAPFIPENQSPEDLFTKDELLFTTLKKLAKNDSRIKVSNDKDGLENVSFLTPSGLKVACESSLWSDPYVYKTPKRVTTCGVEGFVQNPLIKK